MTKDWREYEKLAQFLLNKFAGDLGLERVEGKQKIPGASGAAWEIDAKGITENGEGIIVVEGMKPWGRILGFKVFLLFL